jgi:hypothetical protein
MLAVAGYFQYRARFLPCPADPSLATACVRQRRASQILYGVSVVIYVVGGVYAFVAPYFL